MLAKLAKLSNDLTDVIKSKDKLEQQITSQNLGIIDIIAKYKIPILASRFFEIVEPNIVIFLCSHATTLLLLAISCHPMK